MLVKAQRVGRLVGYLAASLLPCLIYLFSLLNSLLDLVDRLYDTIFLCFSLILLLAIGCVVLIFTRKVGYLLCIVLSIAAGVAIEGAINRPLQRMDLKFRMNLAKYEEVVLMAEKGLLTSDPEAGTSYTNPERSYQLPTEYYGLSDSHRIQITNTDLGRFIAFYYCGTLSRCSAYVYSSNPGIPLPRPFDWPFCRDAANGALKNWSVCFGY